MLYTVKTTVVRSDQNGLPVQVLPGETIELDPEIGDPLVSRGILIKESDNEPEPKKVRRGKAKNNDETEPE